MRAPETVSPRPETTAEAPPFSAARRLGVIYNPVAGWGRRTLFQRTLKALEALGCDIVLQQTNGHGDAEDMARQAGDVDRLVVAGGDGTVNEALNGLAGRRLPLALIPLGTANVLAHELGLSFKPERIARTIAYGPSVGVHLGELNGRRFAQMAGVGFDAQLVQRVDRRVKKRISQGAYVLAFFHTMAVFRPPRYQVWVDGEHQEAASVVVAKGRRYGGRFILAPEARPWRPELHVCLYDSPGRMAMLGYARDLVLGRLHKRRDFRILRARHVQIAGPEGEPVQIDGDHLTHLPVDIRLLDNTAELVVPEGELP